MNKNDSAARHMQIMQEADQAFRAALQRALDASVDRDGLTSAAVLLTGRLADLDLFDEVAALTEAVRKCRAARQQAYRTLLGLQRHEHEATMRDDDGTPEYLREGVEAPEPPISVRPAPPWNFKGGEPCPVCRGACCWEHCVGELAHADPAERPDATHRCPACADGTASSA
jgi:hypothetical protein